MFLLRSSLMFLSSNCFLIESTHMSLVHALKHKMILRFVMGIGRKLIQRNPDENLTSVCFARRIFSEVEVRKQVFSQPIFPQKLNF